jgi:hypothetical protein
VALRTNGGDVDRAVDQLSEAREAERKKNRDWHRQRKWRKTSNGDKVKLDSVEFLVSAGVEEAVAVAALRKTNNDVDRALQVRAQA